MLSFLKMFFAISLNSPIAMIGFIVQVAFFAIWATAGFSWAALFWVGYTVGGNLVFRMIPSLGDFLTRQHLAAVERAMGM